MGTIITNQVVKSIPVLGVPILAQWVTKLKLTSILEDPGLIPGLTQGIGDPALPWQ